MNGGTDKNWDIVGEVSERLEVSGKVERTGWLGFFLISCESFTDCGSYCSSYLLGELGKVSRSMFSPQEVIYCQLDNQHLIYRACFCASSFELERPGTWTLPYNKSIQWKSMFWTPLAFIVCVKNIWNILWGSEEGIVLILGWTIPLWWCPSIAKLHSK